MNYINQLQDENKLLKKQIHFMQEEIISFRSFLVSQKFWQDTTIQVADVDNKLMHILSTDYLYQEETHA